MNKEPITINSVAERILFGPNISDKIYFDKNAQDKVIKTPKALPTQPRRSEKIKISFERSERFPSKNSLSDDKEKAKALHHFANHELLAIELMALTLLKFPEAPKAFRKGIYQTISEEQKHFRLYVNRIEEFGYSFGDFPLNGFFWSHMSKIKSIEEYLSQMSLTFEQANLDFATYYRDIFKSIGDKKTAQILDEVLQDEIGHVKFGKVWLEKSGPKSISLWDRFKEHLKFPITPARAKGKHFNREARIKADLPEEFIYEIEQYTQSKGRVPNVYYFNPDAELEIATENYAPRAYASDLAHDLEDIYLFLAPRDEVVLLRERPCAEFIDSIKPLVPHPPELLLNDSELKSKIEGRRFNEYRPWAFSPSSLIVKSSKFPDTNSPNPEHIRKWHSKTFAFQLLANFVDSTDAQDDLIPKSHLGTIASSIEELNAFIQADSDFRSFLVRGPFGVSGQNARVITKESLHLITPFLEEQFDLHREVLVEPYYDVEDSFSFQIRVTAEGGFRFLGLSQFLTDKKDQYKGALVRPNLRLKSRKTQFKILKTIKSECWLQSLLSQISKQYSELGYFGSMGIDAFTYNFNGSTFIKPLSEVNCRYNFGSMTIALRKLVAPGKQAKWEILNKPNAPKASKYETKNGMITKGHMLTNDPLKARRFVSVLSVE